MRFFDVKRGVGCVRVSDTDSDTDMDTYNQHCSQVDASGLTGVGGSARAVGGPPKLPPWQRRMIGTRSSLGGVPPRAPPPTSVMQLARVASSANPASSEDISRILDSQTAGTFAGNLGPERSKAFAPCSLPWSVGVDSLHLCTRFVCVPVVCAVVVLVLDDAKAKLMEASLPEGVQQCARSVCVGVARSPPLCRVHGVALRAARDLSPVDDVCLSPVSLWRCVHTLGLCVNVGFLQSHHQRQSRPRPPPPPQRPPPPPPQQRPPHQSRRSFLGARAADDNMMEVVCARAHDCVHATVQPTNGSRSYLGAWCAARMLPSHSDVSWLPLHGRWGLQWRTRWTLANGKRAAHQRPQTGVHRVRRWPYQQAAGRLRAQQPLPAALYPPHHGRDIGKQTALRRLPAEKDNRQRTVHSQIPSRLGRRSHHSPAVLPPQWTRTLTHHFFAERRHVCGKAVGARCLGGRRGSAWARVMASPVVVVVSCVNVCPRGVWLWLIGAHLHLAGWHPKGTRGPGSHCSRS